MVTQHPALRLRGGGGGGVTIPATCVGPRHWSRRRAINARWLGFFKPRLDRWRSEFGTCSRRRKGTSGVKHNGIEGVIEFWGKKALLRSFLADGIDFKLNPNFKFATFQNHMLRVLNGDDMYSTMTIAAHDGLKLKVVEAKFADSEIIVLLRELGTGKTAFIHLLGTDTVEGPHLKSHGASSNLAACLSREEAQGLTLIVRRFVTLFNKTAFVVEHDFTMARHLAYKVIVFEGTPSIDCVAKASQLWNHFSGKIITSLALVQDPVSKSSVASLLQIPGLEFTKTKISHRDRDCPNICIVYADDSMHGLITMYAFT
ncbi:ABC transporter E family member 2 [Tanacetum coccineum]